ncbi:MAG: hypothetical protein ACRC1K_10795 [Planctomycetia bacterium]
MIVLAGALTLCATLPLWPNLQLVVDRREVLEWNTHRAGANVLAPFVAAFPSGALVLLGTAMLAGVPPFGSGAGALNRTAPAGRTLLVIVGWWALPVLLLTVIAEVGHRPSLTQPRYMAAFSVVCTLAAAWGVARLTGAGGRRFVFVQVVGFVLAGWAIAQSLRHPTQFDAMWKDAAQFLSKKATADDLVFVQTGLVEAGETPLRFADPAFQEYTSSRLSDYYLRSSVKRLTLPLFWQDGDWRKAYAAEVARTKQADGVVWMVMSSDTDVGEALEKNTLDWLRSLGVRMQPMESPRAARLWRSEPK